jgi:acyl-CoA thioesterase-1
MSFKNIIRWHLPFLLLLGMFTVRPVFAETLLILGDSLSAGYRLPADQAWPTLMANKFQQDNKNITVVNASISGHTASQSLAQLPELLKKHQPKWVLIELGANDGLQGLAVDSLREDLSAIIAQVQQAGGRPLLMQIRIPPNYGVRYTNAFSAIYPQLAEKYAIPLLPFFMERIILNDRLIQSDQIHPNGDAQPIIADIVAQDLAPYLK